MEGEQLPKATMNHFIKQKTSMSYSPDFVVKMLGLSKEFVWRVSDRANAKCEQAQKKTINAEHLEAALEELHLMAHLGKLKQLGSHIKQFNQQKKEANQRLEEIIEQQMKEERERRQSHGEEKKAVVQRIKFDHIQAIDLEPAVEEDYQNLQPDKEMDEVKEEP